MKLTYRTIGLILWCRNTILLIYSAFLTPLIVSAQQMVYTESYVTTSKCNDWLSSSRAVSVQKAVWCTNAFIWEALLCGRPSTTRIAPICELIVDGAHISILPHQVPRFGWHQLERAQFPNGYRLQSILHFIAASYFHILFYSKTCQFPAVYLCSHLRQSVTAEHASYMAVLCVSVTPQDSFALNTK